MKKTQIATIACFTIIMLFGFWFHARSSTPVQQFVLEDSGYSLHFAPIAVEPLLVATPGSHLVRVKTVPVAGVGAEVWVHLYRYATDLHSNDVIGFMTDGQKVYSLGTLSIYGEQDVAISTMDSNQDGIKEMQITGSFDATVNRTQIVGQVEGHWSKLLSAHNLAFYDLDQDGKEEMVAISQGNLPADVIIFQWKNNHFEKTDVAGSTGSVYASLLPQGNTAVIKAGKEIDHQVQDTFYHYSDGKLFNIRTTWIDHQ